MNEQQSGNRRTQLLRWMCFFAASALLFFRAARGGLAVKYNVASVLTTRALISPIGPIDSSPLLIGHFRVLDRFSMDKAMTLWKDDITDGGNYLYALLLYAQGNYVAAITEMETRPIRILNSVEALLLGQAWYALGCTAEAGAIWRQANADLPLRFLADQNLRAGDFESALPIYLRLEAIWPQDGEIQWKLGDLYRNQAVPNFERAVVAYRRAAALGQDPDQMQLLIIITELAATRDLVMARIQLEAMLARADLAPDNRVTALRVMHNIYRYYLNDFIQAEAYLLAAIKLPRKEGDVWEELQLAQAYLENGDCDAAQRWIIAAEGRGAGQLVQFQRVSQEMARLCDLR